MATIADRTRDTGDALEWAERDSLVAIQILVPRSDGLYVRTWLAHAEIAESVAEVLASEVGSPEVRYAPVPVASAMADASDGMVIVQSGQST